MHPLHYTHTHPSTPNTPHTPPLIQTPYTPHTQAPESLTSFSMAIQLLTVALGSYLSSLLVIIIGAITGTPGWLPPSGYTVNQGHMDYCTCVLCVMCVCVCVVRCVCCVCCCVCMLFCMDAIEHVHLCISIPPPSPTLFHPPAPSYTLFHPTSSIHSYTHSHRSPHTVFYLLAVLQMIGVGIHIPVSMVGCFYVDVTTSACIVC